MCYVTFRERYTTTICEVTIFLKKKTVNRMTINIISVFQNRPPDQCPERYDSPCLVVKNCPTLVKREVFGVFFFPDNVSNLKKMNAGDAPKMFKNASKSH